MAENINEQLSALVDGENQQAELDLLFRRVARDSTLRDQWERYHLISDTLRQHLPDPVPVGFVQRVMDAIQNDEAATGTASSQQPVVQRSTWLKPVAGFALAASVAMVAVLSFDRDELSAPQGSLIASVGSPETSTPSTGSGLELDERLSAYLVNHSEYVSMNGVNGVIPYARMVGFQTQH